MPVYLTVPGYQSSTPWRSTTQVFAHPVEIVPDDEDPAPSATEDAATAEGVVPDEQPRVLSLYRSSPHVIRRLRHSEIILVDDVCIAYGRYWLRLRWPGHRGGFAGYVALDTTLQQEPDAADRFETGSMPPSEPDDDTDEDHPHDAQQERSIYKFLCRRTGIEFRSSRKLLLLHYDDGITPSPILPPYHPTEPVFCRICREGLHEDVDEQQPGSGMDEEDIINTAGTQQRSGTQSRDTSNHTDTQPIDTIEPVEEEEDEDQDTVVLSKGPVHPHPVYTANAEAMHNPMMAPCECAGSMRFVHYLCVEQWRCRSRHPEAANGLNCETCGKPYALPPPLERPIAQVSELEQDELIDAMPPHVMHALRNPHWAWRMGTRIVRYRWLRPLAPVFASPIVAIYCRARRLLKKRGVARRRWACSLCRRRARWKCVRCLRSYYCSRQCQNVAWHIIHKHVCYKPARFWWSVVVYGILALVLFPGILRDPFLYDIGFSWIPANFLVLGTLAGGFASAIKKYSGVDWRGRILELAVVITTVGLSIISWGLVRGFFGSPHACFGVLGAYHVHEKDLIDYNSTFILRGLRAGILRPAAKLYMACDQLFAKSPSLLRTALCMHKAPQCFEHLPFANPNFFLVDDENNVSGGKCAADTLLFTGLYLLAGLVFLSSILFKHYERQQRRRLRQHQQQQQQQQQQLQQPQRFMAFRGGQRPPIPNPQHLHQD